MNRLTKMANACLTTGIALIASVTLLAGDKVAMAMSDVTCYQCLGNCPSPVTAACYCNCATNFCQGTTLNPVCSGAGTATCDPGSPWNAPCTKSHWPCGNSDPKGKGNSACQVVPQNCPSNVDCSNCGCRQDLNNTCTCA